MNLLDINLKIVMSGTNEAKAPSFKDLDNCISMIKVEGS